MASVKERELGQAESTAAGNDAAIKLYDAYRKKKNRSKFNEMRFIEIEEDNLEGEFFFFTRWLSSTPIPFHFDEKNIYYHTPPTNEKKVLQTFCGT